MRLSCSLREPWPLASFEARAVAVSAAAHVIARFAMFGEIAAAAQAASQTEYLWWPPMAVVLLLYTAAAAYTIFSVGCCRRSLSLSLQMNGLTLYAHRYSNRISGTVDKRQPLFE